ncbi:MAG: DUF5060 domain-containing protein [Bryobacteraceae bacterium]
MLTFRLMLLAGIGLSLFAQAPCAGTPEYIPCEFVYELNAQEAAAHPNPYVDVQLHAEFRSPRFRTFKMPAFWDGGQRLVIRFTPTDAGDWNYRVTSNIQRWDGQTGTFTTAASEAPGFVRKANVHHWAWTERNLPHLWMGDTLYPFATLEQVTFQQIVDARATQKFNHIRGSLLPAAEQAARAFPSSDRPDPAWFRQVDERVRYMNQKGIVADLILAASPDQITRLFPNWQQRQRYVNYLVAHYAAFNITWQGLREFEAGQNGRPLMKEIGGLLKQTDPYQHPQSSGNVATSGPLLEDGWMNFIAHHTSDDQVCAVEHQIFATPFVNLKFAGEDTGAGKFGPEDVDSDTFRHRLWNAAMDGDYLTYFNTGTAGAGKLPVDPKYLDSPGAKAMTAWFNILSASRYWELEPYFDVDGGRAVALEDVEYLVYIEKPGPVEVVVEHHGYDVSWFNPITGEELKEKKGYKGEHFTGEPPDKSHDWILRISREGHKEGMRSYKFESRRIEMQVIEQNVQKVPFEIAQPTQTALSESKPAEYAAKIKRETRATRSVMWLWTGEATADGQGYRVIGTGQQGTLHFWPDMALNYPAVLSMRLYGMNANGKVYTVDKTYQLEK